MFRVLLAILTLMIILPIAHADMQITIYGSSGLPVKASAAVDSNKDGLPDTAVLGTDAGTISFGLKSFDVTVPSVRALAPVDIDSDGYLSGVVVASSQIMGIGVNGVKWTIPETFGYSAMAIDLNGDGKANEVVVGGASKLYALNASNGSIIWSNDLTGGTGFITSLVQTKELIIGGSGNLVFAVNKFGGHVWSKALITPQGSPVNLAGISPIALGTSEDVNGVVIVTADGNISGIDMSGTVKWSLTRPHEGKNRVRMFPVDRTSKGKRDYVVFNLDFAVYWVSSSGTEVGRVEPAGATALALIDYDGDGISDDIIVGKDTEKGKTYAYSAFGSSLGTGNTTGASEIVAIDFDGDGKVDDAIAYSFNDKNVYNVLNEFTDLTKRAAPPVTTPPPTTPPPTTPAPTTPPPTTPPPIVLQEMSVNAGNDKNVLEGEPVTLTADARPSTTTGEIKEYSWTEREDVIGKERTLTKTFPVGVHEIHIKVTDDKGKTANDTVLVTVNPVVREVKVDAGPDLNVMEGVLVTLLANATPSKLNGNIVSYQWTTDGKLLGNAKTITVMLPPGIHSIILTVVDNEGATASDEVKITVTGSGISLPNINIGNISNYFNVLKLVVVIGIGLLILIFLREKILDFLWERRKDYGE